VRDDSLGVEIVTFGSPGEGGKGSARFRLKNNGPGDLKLTAKLEIAGKEFRKEISVRGGSSVDAEIPYEVELFEPGELQASLSVSENNPGKVLHLSSSRINIPYMSLSNYGYRITAEKGEQFKKLGLWWCEGTYKVSRTRALPGAAAKEINISAAGNEYEPFQLVLRPEKDLETVTVNISALERKEGGNISAENITIDLAGYVDIKVPTDEAGSPGLWPDPLPHYTSGFRAKAGQNQPLWVTIYVPAKTPAGDYLGEITLKAGKEIAKVPLRLRVWDFSLPKETHLRSGFGFDVDTVRKFHNLRTTAENREVIDLYYVNFTRHRLCPYTPMRPPVARFTRDTETRKVVDVTVDFTRFDEDCSKYLDEMGFNAFSLRIDGMGSGTFFNRQAGVFGGLKQGTPEYDTVWGKYMRTVQEHLEEKGWLNKAYIYWFDEPEPKDYPFVKEGMENIKKAAPKLARMLTEEPGPDLAGSVDLWCPILHCYDPEKAHERQKQGEEIWWYVCTGPKAPYLGLFIDHPAVDLRVWSWMSWQFNVQGLLIWDTDWWTSPAAFPKKPQNPWEDPMSYAAGYGLQAGQLSYWGNGDGRFFYPPNRDVTNDKSKYIEGPVNSIRWEMLREGIEDYEYFWLLRDKIEKLKKTDADRKVWGEAEKLLDIPKEIFTDPANYSKNPRSLYEYREKVARAIEQLPKQSTVDGPQ